MGGSLRFSLHTSAARTDALRMPPACPAGWLRFSLRASAARTERSEQREPHPRQAGGIVPRDMRIACGAGRASIRESSLHRTTCRSFGRASRGAGRTTASFVGSSRSKDEQIVTGGPDGPARNSLYNAVSRAFLYQMTGDHHRRLLAGQRLQLGKKRGRVHLLFHLLLTRSVWGGKIRPCPGPTAQHREDTFTTC